jgi:hypothetical protein
MKAKLISFMFLLVICGIEIPAQPVCMGCAQPIGPLNYQSVDPPTFTWIPAQPYICTGTLFCINRSICPPAFPMTCNFQQHLFMPYDSCYTLSNAEWSEYIPDTSYYWLVKTQGNMGNQWCSCMGPIKRVLAELPPVSATLPVNGAYGVSLTALFDWEKIPDASSYRLTIYGTPFLNSIVLDTSVTVDSVHAAPGKLALNNRYWWRVKAYKTGGQGPYSDLRVFSTGLVRIITLNSEIPVSYVLYQNYPNPFNPVTKIRFDIPKTDLVILNIFDVLGREVWQLVNEQLDPGTYEVDWNAANYPSGIYYYTIKTTAFSQTKKMVLIK